MQSKNNGTLFEKNDSTERLNVANGNGGGHGVPNGNSHKGQLTASWLESSMYISSVKGIDISYTLDSASVYQKVKPKISAVSPHNNRRRPYWSFPLIKKCYRKRCTFLHLCIKYFLAAYKRTYCQLVHFRNTKYTNYHAPCRLCGNDQRLQPGFNFRLPTMWDAASSVYEISMVKGGAKVGRRRSNCVKIHVL